VSRAAKHVEPTRTIPNEMDQDGRESFLAIGQRARVEAVHCYTVLGLGLQAFFRSQEVERKSKA
jgi:hypothetical protein